MLIANVECDEIINQIVTSLTKRTWLLYYNDRLIFQRKKRDLRTLKKIIKRLKWSSFDYCLEQEIIYPRLDDCLLVLGVKLKYLQDKLNCTNMVLWLGPDDGSNFRYKKAITLPYKGTRGPKPDVLIQLRQYLINIKNARVIYGYEADDALGIYQIDSEVYETVAVHCDKDIFMIPGVHYNTITDEFVHVSRLGELIETDKGIKGNGLRFFYYQLLIGDKVDNIPSLHKGLGPKFAYKCLKNCLDEEDLLESVLFNYRVELASTVSDTVWKERLLEQADLVWICQNEKEIGSQYIQRRYKEIFKKDM